MQRATIIHRCITAATTSASSSVDFYSVFMDGEVSKEHQIEERRRNILPVLNCECNKWWIIMFMNLNFKYFNVGSYPLIHPSSQPEAKYNSNVWWGRHESLLLLILLIVFIFFLYFLFRGYYWITPVLIPFYNSIRPSVLFIYMMAHCQKLLQLLYCNLQCKEHLYCLILVMINKSKENL